MLNKIKKQIDLQRNTQNTFWKTFVFLKDFSWTHFDPTVETALFPYYLIRDLKFKKTFVKTQKKLICFEVLEKFFFANYVDVYEGLKNEFDVYFVCPDKNFSDLKNHIVSQGIDEGRILPSAFAFFIKWEIYINCWVPRYYPNITQKNKIKKIQIYHGFGVYNLKNDKTQVNKDSCKRLKKFDFHFIIGPQYEKTIKMIADKNNIYKIGYPKLDKLFNDSKIEGSVIKEIKFPDAKKIVLYAPHHNPLLSFNNFGVDIINEILKLNVNLVIKLHNAMLKNKEIMDSLKKIEKENDRFHIARQEDSTLYYPISDLVITDIGTSAAAEAALCEKPVILINSEKWFEHYGKDNVENKISDVFPLINSPKEIKTSVSNTLLNGENLKKNKDLVEKYFYNPGTATQKSISIIKIIASL